LDKCLSQELLDFRIQSAYFNKGLVSRIDTVYLNFGSWISLFYDDGVLFIKEGTNFKTEIALSNNDIMEYKFLDLNTAISNYREILNGRLTEISIDNFKLLLTFNSTYLLTIEQQEIKRGWFGETVIDLRRK
jgi:hypothetical protein